MIWSWRSLRPNSLELFPAAIPRAVISLEIAALRAVGTILPGAIDRAKLRSARWRRAEYAGRAEPRAGWIGGKIAGKEAVGREVADVVAAIIIPGGRRCIPAQQRLVRALRRRGRRRRDNRCGGEQPSQLAHAVALGPGDQLQHGR